MRTFILPARRYLKDAYSGDIIDTQVHHDNSGWHVFRNGVYIGYRHVSLVAKFIAEDYWVVG